MRLVRLSVAVPALIVLYLGVNELAWADLALYANTHEERVVATAPQRYEKIPASSQVGTGAIYSW